MYPLQASQVELLAIDYSSCMFIGIRPFLFRTYGCDNCLNFKFFFFYQWTRFRVPINIGKSDSTTSFGINT
jgi:hypothetical protein